MAWSKEKGHVLVVFFEVAVSRILSFINLKSMG